MDFQQQFIDTAKTSPQEAAALVGARIEELREGSEGLSLLGAFTSVVENDLKGVAQVIYSGNDRMVVTRQQPACVEKAMDLALDNVMVSLFTAGAPAAAP